MLEGLFGNVNVVEKALGGLTSRQRAIGENIANVDTPLYKRMEAFWDNILDDSLSFWRTAGYKGLTIGAQDYLGGVVEADRDAHTVREACGERGQQAYIEWSLRQPAPGTLAKIRFEACPLLGGVGGLIEAVREFDAPGIELGA